MLHFNDFLTKSVLPFFNSLIDSPSCYLYITAIPLVQSRVGLDLVPWHLSSWYKNRWNTKKKHENKNLTNAGCPDECRGSRDDPLCITGYVMVYPPSLSISLSLSLSLLSLHCLCLSVSLIFSLSLSMSQCFPSHLRGAFFSFSFSISLSLTSLSLSFIISFPLFLSLPLSLRFTI